jgi:uncharacterized protein (DUF1501 family)
MHPTLTRRTTLLGLTGLAMSSRVKMAFADAPTDQRFVVILLRGALDGMSTLVPYGDPNLAGLRQPLIPPAPGQPGGMYDLGGFYGLNPALPGLYALYQQGQVLPFHAVAGPYRTRSHFEAQDLLQLGAGGDETSITSGWLNRVLAALPARPGRQLAGLSIGIGTPLLLQGPVPVGSYAPAAFAVPSPDLYARIAALNAGDPLTGPAISAGLQEMQFDNGLMPDQKHPKNANSFPNLATKAGTLLAAADGPRIAAFQLEGWDTHGQQVGGLKGPLSGLDQGIGNLKTALGPAWANTMVLVITEFGRTAAINGTAGTDHGTATVAFLLGGTVAGGKVRATWPGLSSGQLFENRDLAPTMDVRAVAKGALAAHLGLDDGALARVFPESGAASPLQGLVRTA